MMKKAIFIGVVALLAYNLAGYLWDDPSQELGKTGFIQIIVQEWMGALNKNKGIQKIHELIPTAEIVVQRLI